MKAVGYRTSHPADHPEALIDVDLPMPQATGRDLLVKVEAVSVNPVDYKVRSRAEPPPGEVKVLGYDAAGTVHAVGPDCRLFCPGDAVFYAGDIRRSGTNAEYHLVDERIVGRKPASVDFADAAALPLTSITAWELLFDRLAVSPGGGAGTALLIIGGAGGVGSILIQLARQLTSMTVIATASRPESADWCRDLGAHHVVDHTGDLAAQVAALGAPPVSWVASLTQTEQHFATIAQIVAPQGRIALIDDPGLIDVRLLKQKSVSLHWELMFTRSMFQTPDMIRQHELLNTVADLVDNGRLRTTVREHFAAISARNLIKAHRLLESGRSRGKLVLAGFVDRTA
jgi:zinc-binding alcohol dehydrogenase family protein